MGIINLIFSPFGLSDCPVGILLGSHVVTPRFTSSLFGVEWKRGRISPFTLALDVTLRTSWGHLPSLSPYSCLVGQAGATC